VTFGSPLFINEPGILKISITALKVILLHIYPLLAKINNNRNACDTSNKDLRPAKRQKPRLVPAITPTTSRGPILATSDSLAPLWHCRLPYLRSTTCNLRLITNACRPSLIIAATMPCDPLEACL
jgi:hypothetical protein